MKLFIIFFLTILSVSAIASERTYSFTRTETMAGKVNSLEGIVSFSREEKKELIKVNFIGNEKFNFWDDINFQTEIPLQYGFEIYDIRKKNDVMGFSIFAHHINIDDFKPGFKTRSVETERRHPFFKDYSWHFYLKYEKNESISLNGKSYQAAYISVKGDRPSGGMNCRPGQPGVIKIDSWYDLKDSKLLKQVFAKYLCKPFDYNLLEKDTYILQ
jgi:hypothetical protein